MSSVNPNDPFDQPGGSAGQPAGTPSSATAASTAPAKKKSRLAIWLVGGCGTVMLLSLLVCCGGIYFLLNFLTDSYQQQLANNPVIREHLGEIESLDMNLTKTAEAAESSDGDTFAFDIQGSVASGTILIKQDPGGNGTGIASAELILEDGTRHQIPIGDAPPDIDTDFEIDLGEPESAMEAPEADESSSEPNP